MSEQFPNPCCRCGFCCMITPCKVAIEVVKGSKQNEPCPALMMEPGNLTSCAVYRTLVVQVGREQANKLMGVGIGCCIKAKAFALGFEIDFASLPPATKVGLVKRFHGRINK